jgi:hypothetical protein
MVDLAAFISRYLGRANTGDTPENKGQCVGLVEVWLNLNNKPHVWGNAVDLLANADAKVFRKVMNIPTNNPPPGAVVCWDRTWGAGFGHTAVVLASNVMGLVVFEQNDPTGSPPVVATHSYNGVAGWLVFS